MSDPDATTNPPSDPPKPATTDPPAAAWTDGLDAASKSFAEARGFKGMAEVLAAVRDAQPPENAEGYELPVPEGEAPDLANAVRPIFHKAGLSAAQAKAVTEGWNEFQATQRAAAEESQRNAETEAAALAERQRTDLKREWGETYDAKTEGARRAAVAFTPGKDDADKLDFLSTMEKRFGYAGMMKFWASVGEHMAEAQAHGIGGGAGATRNPASFYDKSGMNP